CRARLHARGARLERDGDRSLPAARLRRDRCPPRLLHRQSRGRPDHVARSVVDGVILALESSCDETAAAVADGGRLLPSVVASLYLEPEPLEPPFLLLLASGGHTLLAEVDDHGPDFRVIGRTLDDAAGEAFDKGARLLGLGYPGGAALERLAADGDPDAHPFP